MLFEIPIIIYYKYELDHNKLEKFDKGEFDMKLKKLTNNNEEEKACAITCLEAIINCLHYTPKVKIGCPFDKIQNKVSYPADSAIYYERNKMYIPEQVISSIIVNDSYLDIESIVDILKNTEYDNHPIITSNFYQILHVSTIFDEEFVDCLEIDFSILKKIIFDLTFGI